MKRKIQRTSSILWLFLILTLFLLALLFIHLYGPGEDVEEELEDIKPNKQEAILVNKTDRRFYYG